MKIKVRKGYTLFLGSQIYDGGSVIEIKDISEVADQIWKIEVVDEEAKKTMNNVADRMIKSKDTVTKSGKK